LDDARNFSLEGERTEAETAYAELAKERARTTAELAAVVLARLELRFPCVFDTFCCSCHFFCSLSVVRTGKDSVVFLYAPTRKGIPKPFSKARAPLSSCAVVTMVTFIPLSL